MFCSCYDLSVWVVCWLVCLTGEICYCYVACMLFCLTFALDCVVGWFGVYLFMCGRIYCVFVFVLRLWVFVSFGFAVLITLTIWIGCCSCLHCIAVFGVDFGGVGWICCCLWFVVGWLF